MSRSNTAFAVQVLLEEDPRLVKGSFALESNALIDLVHADPDMRDTVLLAAGATVEAKPGFLSRGLKKLGKVAKRTGGKAKKLVKKATSSLKKKAHKFIKKSKPKKPKKALSPAQRAAARKRKAWKPANNKRPNKRWSPSYLRGNAETMAVVKALVSAASALEAGDSVTAAPAHAVQMKRWMMQHAEDHVDPKTGELNMTGLAEEAQAEFDAYNDDNAFELAHQVGDKLGLLGP